MEVLHERIVAAAVDLRGTTGGVYSLPPPARHGEVIYLVHAIFESRDPDFVVRPDQQGFVTSGYRFVSREEACVIARRADQIRHKTGSDDVLYSECIW